MSGFIISLFGDVPQCHGSTESIKGISHSPHLQLPVPKAPDGTSLPDIQAMPTKGLVEQVQR